jgi:hypothetical protein
MSAPDANYIEPFFFDMLSHFNRLMDIYNANEASDEE